MRRLLPAAVVLVVVAHASPTLAFRPEPEEPPQPGLRPGMLIDTHRELRASLRLAHAAYPQLRELCPAVELRVEHAPGATPIT